MFRVDVVRAVVPMLVSQQALTLLKGKMDFSNFTLEITGHYTIRLAKSSTGHVLLPGMIAQESMNHSKTLNVQVFPMQRTTPELRVLTDSQILKIHRQLGHCSDKQLTDLLNFGGCKVNPVQIRRVSARCNCQRSVHRITPPAVSSWIARFSGEVVANGIIRPFTETGPEGPFRQRKATGCIPA